MPSVSCAGYSLQSLGRLSKFKRGHGRRLRIPLAISNWSFVQPQAAPRSACTPARQQQTPGSVHLESRPDGSTLVRVSLQDNRPGGALAQVISALFEEDPGREDRGGPDATQGRPRARPRGSRRSTAGLCHGSGLRGGPRRSIDAVGARRAPSGRLDAGVGRRLRAHPIHTRRCSGRRDTRLRVLRTSAARPVARGRTACTPRSRTLRPLGSRSPPSPHRRRRRGW